MKHLSWILALAVVLVAACGGGGSESANGDGPTEDRPAVMAAALEQLISDNHTFGDGPPPFVHYLLMDATDPAAGTGSANGAARPLTEAERNAIEDTVRQFGEVQWIADPDEFRTDDLQPTVENAVIIGVGEPSFDRDGALVPVSLWCGGLCGTWLTYRVEWVDGVWTVTGIEGPVAIS